MAANRMDIGSFVGMHLTEEDADVLREGVRVLAQAPMDAEVSTQIGAALYERSDQRTAHRNGYRTGRGTPGWARSSSGYQRWLRGFTSP